MQKNALNNAEKHCIIEYSNYWKQTAYQISNDWNIKSFDTNSSVIAQVAPFVKYYFKIDRKTNTTFLHMNTNLEVECYSLYVSSWKWLQWNETPTCVRLRFAGLDLPAIFDGVSDKLIVNITDNLKSDTL